MLEVSVYKGAERQIRVWGLSFTYALALFGGLLVTVGGYLFASVVYGVGFFGLLIAMSLFGAFAYMVVKISRKYGRGGLSKSIASKKVPNVIVGGITPPTRLAHLELCSRQQKK